MNKVKSIMVICAIFLGGISQSEIKAQDTKIVIASDPQPVFLNDLIGPASHSAQEKSVYMISNTTKRILQEDIEGVIINGDLVMSGANLNTLYKNNVSDEIIDAGLDYYPGLGNHDVFGNSVNLKLNKANITANHLISAVSRLERDEKLHAKDGLHYAYLIDEYLFVQLNISPFITWNYGIVGQLAVDESIGFMNEMIDDAISNEWKVILNYHAHNDDKYGWDSANWNRFTQSLKNSTVVAVFAGHFHGNLGFNSIIAQNKDSLDIPLYYSGAMYLGSYLVVHLKSDRILVQPKIFSTSEFRTTVYSRCENRLFIQYLDPSKNGLFGGEVNSNTANRYYNSIYTRSEFNNMTSPTITGNITNDAFTDLMTFDFYNGNINVARNTSSVNLTNGSSNGYMNVYNNQTLELNKFIASWSTMHHTRLLGDVNGDGYDDIIGVGNSGVVVGLSDRGVKIQSTSNWSSELKAFQNGTIRYPYLSGDINGDGKDDLVNLTNSGIRVALSNGQQFESPVYWNSDIKAAKQFYHLYAYRLADVNGDGNDDFVAFLENGVHVAISNPNENRFNEPTIWTSNFGFSRSSGNWNGAYNYRDLGDVNNDGKADIIGFGNSNVLYSISSGGGFQEPSIWVTDQDFVSGWCYENENQKRFIGDVDGNGTYDLIAINKNGLFYDTSKDN